MFERFPLLIRRTLAWGVHFVTASGALWGFLTLLAVWEQNFKLAFVYIIIAMVVDGIDGILARVFRVDTYAGGLDGALLDNIIDYLNYVVVAALLLVRVPNLLPAGYELAGAAAVLLSSGYQFAQYDAKTDEQSYFFKGFPSLWNFLVIYLMLLGLNPWINLAIVLVCTVLVFVPVKYVYPTRNTRLRRLTLGLTIVYGAIGGWGLLQYPAVPPWVMWASFAYIGYYALLSFFPRIGLAKAA